MRNYTSEGSIRVKLQDELSDLVEREAFANSFCHAVKIIAEAIDTMRVLNIDE